MSICQLGLIVSMNFPSLKLDFCKTAVFTLLVSAMPIQVSGAPPAKTFELLQDVKRVVFLGDSITQKGDFVVDVECWLLSNGLSVETLNLGLGSETASELTVEENKGHVEKYGFGKPPVGERLARVLAETKPDLLFVCYGMNDAAMPEGEVGTRRFAEAITRLRQQALDAGVKKVVLCTPPIHDNKKEPAANPADRKLSAYSTWLISQRKEGWQVIDFHTPMQAALDAARLQNPSFTFAEDNVHPNREGHWVLARQLLEHAFGASIDPASNSEQFFPKSGAQIRDLVRRRMMLLAAAWLTHTGHTRPGVAGGPQSQPGLPVPEAESKARELDGQISALLPPSPPNTL